jgi:hypothetical protein
MKSCAPISRGSTGGEAGDLLLFRSGQVVRFGAALSHLLARRDQLPPGALGECLHAYRDEHVVGYAQLLARVEAAAALVAQSLP